MKAITYIFKSTTVQELEGAKTTALLHLETAKDAVADARMGMGIEHFLKEKEKRFSDYDDETAIYVLSFSRE